MLETKHVVDGNHVTCTEYGSPLKNFREGQIGVDEQSKILDCDHITKTFFVERKTVLFSNPWKFSLNIIYTIEKREMLFYSKERELLL